MKLRQAGSRSYYIENNTNIGIHIIDGSKICLIDTGAEGDGEKIDEIIMEQGWQLEYILNTHTHIDHIGGNRYLIEKYKVPAYCTDYDMAFAHYSELEAAYMNGGYPAKKLRTVFAHPGKIGFRDIESIEPEGIEVISLPGHSFGMVGFKTDDDVWFLGDSYLSRTYVKKFHFGFIYNVGAYLETLEKLKGLKGKLFVPSHGISEENIDETVDINIENIHWMINLIKDICREYAGLDNILQQMYARLNIRARVTQQALLSSTVKGYLTYLEDKGEMDCKFIDNIMKWRTNDL